MSTWDWLVLEHHLHLHEPVVPALLHGLVVPESPLGLAVPAVLHLREVGAATLLSLAGARLCTRRRGAPALVYLLEQLCTHLSLSALSAVRDMSLRDVECSSV